MSRWEIRSFFLSQGEEAERLLVEHLRDGWEPFGVTDRNGRLETVHLRKEFDDVKEDEPET